MGVCTGSRMLAELLRDVIGSDRFPYSPCV